MLAIAAAGAVAWAAHGEADPAVPATATPAGTPLAKLREAYQGAAASCTATPSGSTGGSGSSGGSGSDSGSAAGSGAKGSATDKNVTVNQIDFAAPDAPAFTLLGLTPSQITQPQSATQLAAATGTVIGTDGQLRQGAALEVAPFKFLHPSLSEYLTYSSLYNIQFSLATSQAAGGGGGSASMTTGDVDGSLGLRSVLWADNDQVKELRKPYLDIVRADSELDSALGWFRGEPTDVEPGKGFSLTVCRAKKALDVATNTDVTNWDSAQRDDLRDHVDKLQKAFNDESKANDQLSKAQEALKKKWNTTAVVVAAAIGETFIGDKWRNHKFRGGAAWLTGSLGISSWLQVLGIARYHSPAASTTSGDTSLAGIRLIAGTNTAAAFAEGGHDWLRSSVDSSQNDDWWHASAGIEYKVSDNTWLVISFGGDINRKGQNGDFFALSNLKWSTGGQTLKLGNEIK